MSLTRMSNLHNLEVRLCDGRLNHWLVEHTTQNYIKCHEFPTQKLKTFVNLIFMDPCIIDDSAEIPTRCSFVIEFIIPKFIEGSTRFERHTAHHQEL